MRILTPKGSSIAIGLLWKVKCLEIHYGYSKDVIGVSRVAIGAPQKFVKVSKGIACNKKRWCVDFDILVTWEGQRAIMVFIDGSEETPLSIVRPCGMQVPPNEALDMRESPHL